MSFEVSLIDWIEERRLNCLAIAKLKDDGTRQGWLEDESYFLRCRKALEKLADASDEKQQNVPLRMHIALKILRAWNSGTAGYDGEVVVTVNKWSDEGMNGPIPFPNSPFFAEWAEDNGYSKVGEYVGFKFTAFLPVLPTQ